MRARDILETSAPITTQEQDNQNIKRSTRFGGLEELAADQITSLFSLYAHDCLSYTAAMLG